MARVSHARRLAGAALLVLVVFAVREVSERLSRSAPPADTAAATPSTGEGTARAGNAIAGAFRERQYGVWVEGSGDVERLLADDTEGSRHQRFIVRLDDGHTLLISHNIDLAARVPIGLGETVAFRGMYEWNDRGGVVHWTHHDPDARHDGGWLRHRGREYR